jgi:hypothetical protein
LDVTHWEPFDMEAAIAAMAKENDEDNNLADSDSSAT